MSGGHKTATTVGSSVFRRFSKDLEDREEFGPQAQQNQIGNQRAATTAVSSVFRRFSRQLEDREEFGPQAQQNQRAATSTVSSVFRRFSRQIEDREEFGPQAQQNQSYNQKTAIAVVSSVFRHFSQQIEDREEPQAQKAANAIVSSIYRNFTQFIEDREEFESQVPENQKAAKAIVSSIYKHFKWYITDRDGPQSIESLTDFAREFVDIVVDEAFKIIGPESQLHEIRAKLYSNTNKVKDSRPSVFEMADSFIYRILSEAKRRVDQLRLIGVERFSKYSSVEDFKVKDGLEIVARCISTWSFNPHWYFKIIYNGRSVSDTYSYYFTVRWSVPSLSYPVAQVTADIYFIIEVFPMTPPPVHIEVCYRLETNRSNLCAFKTPHLEKWLNTVIKRKLAAFQMFTF